MLKINKKTASVYLPRLIAFFTLLLCSEISVSAQTASSVEDLVKLLSGEKLKVETRATPYQLVGDFNGDKVNDIAVIVNLSDIPANVAKSVKVQYPYYGEKEVLKDDLALFIIHGKGKGWQFAQKSSVLFLGRSSALIFQKVRLDETGDAMKLNKDKRGRVSIYFITEGSDATIRWNGKKYVWTESPD